jgi:hypothetical protein
MRHSKSIECSHIRQTTKIKLFKRISHIKEDNVISKYQWSLIASITIVPAVILFGCGKKEGSGTQISITKTKPPVKEAAGTGLAGASAMSSFFGGRVSVFSVTPTVSSAIKERFFDPSPTSVMDILGAIDRRLGEIETRAAESEKPCLSDTPTDVAMTIYGESVTAKIQCVDNLGATGFIAFGKDGDDWWIIDSVGASKTVAKATVLSDGKNQVEIWGAVGFTNESSFSAWDNGSYGAYHVKANTSTNALEMAAGGIGFGFCGVSLRSDGTNLYVKGSIGDSSCATTADHCVLAQDLTSSSACAGSIDTFTVGKLGRASVPSSAVVQASPASVTNWDASPWAGTSPVTLDGTSGDDVHFISLSELPSSIRAF